MQVESQLFACLFLQACFFFLLEKIGKDYCVSLAYQVNHMFTTQMEAFFWRANSWRTREPAQVVLGL